MKSITMSPFMSQKTVSMIFFNEHGSWNNFFTVESLCLPFNDRSSHLFFGPFEKYLLRNILRRNSSANTTSFVLFNFQKFDERPLLYYCA